MSMRADRYILFSAVLFLFLAQSLAAEQMNSTNTTQSAPAKVINATIVYVKPPVLISPKEEVVDITAKEKLEFKWKAYESPYMVYGYLFRIYRGTDMTKKNEVYAEQVSGLDTSIEVSTDYFEDGETYTWYIKQINNAPPLLFSDPAYWTFKVIKVEE